MGYAVELVLDKADAESLRELYDLTNSVMLELDAIPHVSLAVFEQVDTALLASLVSAFAKDTQPFSLHFSSISIFPGEENVVFLAAVVTENLLRLHADFHARLNALGLKRDLYHLPGTWVPHCTVTMNEPLSQSLETIRMIHNQEVLGEYRVSEIRVIEFRTVVNLASFYLSNGSEKY
jgi:2'-5' RNA ligase